MKRRLVSELNSCINDKVNIQGWVYKIRKLKSISFVILRDRSGLVPVSYTHLDVYKRQVINLGGGIWNLYHF